MRYSKFIKGNEGFQYSINIQYDLMNTNKIKGYIPTRNSVEILKEYLLNDLKKDRKKATVLVGPYGKGKSHLLLVLLGLMCGNSKVIELKELIEKIRLIDNECAEYAEDILNNKKYLPIIINFNSGDLSQAFLIALREALKNEGIENILPNTYFDSALDVLNGWKKYNETYELVKKVLKEEYKLQISTFKRQLKGFNVQAYKIFKEIFYRITSGIEFNPFINTDVVKLYEETNYILKEKYNYDGIIIVFDEFSKFIESDSIANDSINLKILQDICELSDRSNNPQMHLICVTHKTINEYISKISQEKIDAWTSISGRFREIYFNSSSQQNYELISNAILKDKKQVKETLLKMDKDNSIKAWNAEGLFQYEKDDFEEYIIEGCFPLSPYTTYALPIISEKVAQNERTLFTYLSKDEPYSLMDLVTKNEEFKFITIDNLYDYFEVLFKKETFNEFIHDIWVKADTALKIVYSEEEKKIIKALAILYIINDFNVLPPTEHIIINVLDIEEHKVKEVLKELTKLNILVLRRSTDTLDFIPISTVDVNGKIRNLVETRFKVPQLAKSYNELCHLKYVLPKKYNDDYKMTRFFKRTFMTLDQIEAYVKAEKLLYDYSTDGIIIDLVAEKEEEIGLAIKWLDKINDNRIVMVIPNEVSKIVKDISQYDAIEYLKEDVVFLKEDNAIESQLDILLEDVTEKIINYITENYDISSSNCKVYINKKAYTNMKNSNLSSKLSEICKDNFENTPIINNEMINKNHISAPIRKARHLIINMILDESYLNFDYSKNAVECTLFRATLYRKELLEAPDRYDEDINNLLEEIKSFINSTEKKEVSFEKLYKLLTTNEKKIGIRKGVLPIYLAFILKDYKDDAIIYIKQGRNKKEMTLDATLLENINSNPKEYVLKLEKNTVEKIEFIEALAKIFDKYKGATSNNKFADIVLAMKRWVQSLSLFAQNHRYDFQKNKGIDKEVIAFRKELMKYEINYRSFLFVDLLKYLNVTTYEECLNKLKDIKDYLDNHDVRIRNCLIDETNKVIDKNYTGSITGNLKKWYSNLSQEQKSHLYNSATNDLLRFIEKGENNEIETINNLAYIFTGLVVEDWNDDTVKTYLSELEKSKKIIEESEIACGTKNENSLVKISFQGDKEEIVEKTFNRVEISPIGGTLMNSIKEAIEEYSDSIDDNEKRNILMDILSEYI